MKIIIDFGDLTYDESISTKTGNPLANLEISRIIEMLKSQKEIDIIIREQNGTIERKIN